MSHYSVYPTAWSFAACTFIYSFSLPASRPDSLLAPKSSRLQASDTRMIFSIHDALRSLIPFDSRNISDGSLGFAGAHPRSARVYPFQSSTRGMLQNAPVRSSSPSDVSEAPAGGDRP